MLFLLFILLSPPSFSEDPTEITPSPSKSTEDIYVETSPEEPEQKEETTPQSAVSSSFYSEKKSRSFWSFLDDYSLIFNQEQTPKKWGLVPSLYFSRIYGLVGGLRFFVYSVAENGFYLSTALSNQVLTSLVRWETEFTKKHQGSFETKSYFSYDNFLDPHYGQGMETSESDLTPLYAHILKFNYDISYLSEKHFFYGFSSSALFRRERTGLQKDKSYFPTELVPGLKFQVGYDSRNSWKDPQEGQYFSISSGCFFSLGVGSSFCLGETDWRLYFKLLDKHVLALRGFYGQSFIAQTTYSLNYILGGRKVLRGFVQNRFRGDKIYFFQSEVRSPMPFLAKYLSSVVFWELGEVAFYDKSFKGYKGLAWDIGAGLRIAMPPDYTMKIRLDLGVALQDDGKKVNFIVDFFQAF